MTNILLWILSTTFYSGLSFLWIIETGKELSWGPCLIVIALVALLSLPFNINGNVWTVIGNAESEADIYSLFSLYQVAKKDALAVFVAGYQKAGCDAQVICGAVGCQKARQDAVVGVGVAGYQNGVNLACAMIGISLYQTSENETAAYLLAVYQTVLRDGQFKSRAFGSFSSLKSYNP